MGSSLFFRTSQSLLILCRSSSSSSSHRVSRSVVSSCGRIWVDRPGFRRSIPGNYAEGFRVSSRCLRSTGLPFLLRVRGLSSAEASSLTDGFLKDSLLKDAEEKSGASLAVAEKETEKALLAEVEEEGVSSEFLSAFEEETEEARDRDALVAEIKSRELELADLRSALRLVDEKEETVADTNESDLASPEFEDSVEQDAARQVSAALDESGHNSVIGSNGTASTLDKELTSEASIAHPWPEWTQFLKQLEDGGHFDNEEKRVVDLNGSTNEDVGLIKRACLNFARERDDIFIHFPRKDLEAVARFGCPSIDRKVVNAGKRLRDFLAIDEISVCKPCALRSSCGRADFKASADHVSGTPEVIRLLSQYALEVAPLSPPLCKEGLKIPDSVQRSCMNLLKETMTLSATPRDPKLPKVERKPEALRSNRREREGRRRVRDADVEMKPGDWKCEECQYVNFARNRACRECDALRPAPEMRPGDWRCPECQFVNFSRNEVCHDCKVDKPAGVGNDSSFDRGSRYDRGAPQERGSRFDRGSSQDRRSDVRGYDKGSERGSYGRSDTRDERGSDRGWSRERGGLERRSSGDDSRGGGRRSSYEEWKPDLKKRGNFEGEEAKDRKAALDILDDEDDESDDYELDDSEGDDEDISDVDALEDEEFEDMRPAVSASRGRSDTGRGPGFRSRSLGRTEDKDPWWEDDRGFRGEKSDRGSRGGGGRGRARGGGRGGGRGDFGRDSGSSSRDSRPSSYDRFDRDSGRSYGNSERGSGRSYGSSDRDSGRSYGSSSRDSVRPSRGRGGGRGGGRGRGR